MTLLSLQLMRVQRQDKETTPSVARAQLPDKVCFSMLFWIPAKPIFSIYLFDLLLMEIFPAMGLRSPVPQASMITCLTFDRRFTHQDGQRLDIADDGVVTTRP